MSPRRFLALLTRGLLTEMLAPSYAHARNVDLNEAAGRLDDALRDVRLLGGLQDGTWRALVAAKPAMGDDELLELVLRKLQKRRRFKPIRPKGPDEGRAAAVLVLADVAAQMATGDALSMLESEEGAKYLAAGFDVFGRHLAAEILR
ncbi:MAG: hypothetical protein U1E65_33720 [Myxococcota bacterium]